MYIYTCTCIIYVPYVPWRLGRQFCMEADTFALCSTVRADTIAYAKLSGGRNCIIYAIVSGRQFCMADTIASDTGESVDSEFFG